MAVVKTKVGDLLSTLKKQGDTPMYIFGKRNIVNHIKNVAVKHKVLKSTAKINAWATTDHADVLKGTYGKIPNTIIGKDKINQLVIDILLAMNYLDDGSIK